MPDFHFLSHEINRDTPQYGGADNIEIASDSRISNGDTANTMYLKLSNHVGTHIDFPNHFSDSGKTLSDYEAGFWKFDTVEVLEIEAVNDEIITFSEKIDSLSEDTDFLILKTGFERYRGQEAYWKHNPGIEPKMASLLKKRCPKLRVFGFDFISLTPQQNKPVGRQAHKDFLLENEILIVEDMHLSLLSVGTQVEELICLPLALEKSDGAQVSIIAKF